VNQAWGKQVKRPNVVLIVMDATRFDWLSVHGYPEQTTPHLERLAEDGIIFESAFATAPWTPPSHASLFCGTYPSRHGVDVAENLFLSEENRTIAQMLADAGYRTFGILPDVHLSSLRGFHRGFQEYVETWRIPYLHLEYDWLECLARNILFGRDKLTHYTNRVIQRWLKAHARGPEPFFAFVNFKTVHNSYQPPYAFKRQFELKGFGGDLRKAKDYSKRDGYSYMAGRLELTEEEFALVKSWYRGAIAYLDSQIGLLAQFLRGMSVYDDTIIIVTADHGEHFGEHQLAYHLFSLYEPLIHVPLIMSWPAGLPRGRRIGELVSLTDVAPTLVDLLGLEPPREPMQGTSLVPFDGRRYHEEVFAEFGRPHYMLERLRAKFADHDFSQFDRALQCVRTREYKLIVGSDGTEELYALAEDPLESKDRSIELSEVVQDLRSRLQAWQSSMGRHHKGQRMDEDASVLKALEEMGYF